MREIKFRAWDVFEKKMVTDTVDCYASFLANGEVSNASIFGCELMQYTGLHDKNGKEIYEGDIVSVPFSDFVSGVTVRKCEVIYSKYSFMFSDKEYETLYEPKFTSTIKVIGNIYENPELLQ